MTGSWDSQQLTAAQKTQVEEFKEPGPFSIVSYCEALLRPDFYSEELCIILLSMMFKVRISVIDGDSFLAIKVRHTNTHSMLMSTWSMYPDVTM